MKKPAITTELAARLVASQFPQWADLPVRPVELDGWDNTTFRLGDHLSLRLPSADRYAPQVEKEHRWLPFLAQQLQLPIPEPIAKGAPGCGYPRPWSVYRWLEGEPAVGGRIADLEHFADDLAAFLAALHAIDPAGGPAAGEHSFFRGGSLAAYDEETRDAISRLQREIDPSLATAVWEAALSTRWHDLPVWVHGDITPSNLLIVDGRLAGVIDFGCLAVGDPACDLAIGWTFFYGDSRRAFRRGVDDETWACGRGWALWKALITLRDALQTDPPRADRAGLRFGWRLNARATIDEILADLSGR